MGHVNQNTITHHVWASRLPDLNYPDLCVFDLDPSKDDVKSVRAAAVGLRDLLAELGLPSWVKTTGSKGFHIAVPIDGKTPMGTVVRFANAVGTFFVSLAPDQLTQEFSKADRRGRIYVDTGRNGFSATFAAAYTVRARPRAPVSAPCTWEEIERGKVSPDTLHSAEHAGPDREGRRPVGRHAQTRALVEAADGEAAPAASPIALASRRPPRAFLCEF